MRLIHCLNDQEEGDQLEHKRKREAMDLESIKRMISRLFSNIRCKKKEKKDKMKDAGLVLGLGPNLRTSLNERRRNSDTTFNSESNVSSFHLGMGVGLALLHVQNATGVQKMIDLKKEMETLLREIRHEVQRRENTDICSISDDHISLAPSHSRVTASKASLPGPVSVECTGELNYEANDQKTSGINMTEMESELEAELECLQCNLDENSFSLLQCGGDEVDSENTYSLDNSKGEEIGLRNELHGKDGVCAHELERKLHELLETRQQERILELESALQHTEEKLHEIKTEFNLWKETQ